jgi:hypothetical protein
VYPPSRVTAILTLRDVSGSSNAALFDNDLVSPGETLLPCGGAQVRPGDTRARRGHSQASRKDELSSWCRVPVTDSDVPSSLHTASLADGDGASSLVATFVALVYRDARLLQQVLPGDFSFPTVSY